jgi:hypothetical protein
MPFDQAFMYCMLWNTDMNKLRDRMWLAVLEAPLKKSPVKKPKKHNTEK